MMSVVVLIPYHRDRRRQLERCLLLLRMQTYHDYIVWVLDDGSPLRENIIELCGGRVGYHRVRLPEAHARSSNMAWIEGYERFGGDFVILTHPDYLAPRDAIAKLVNGYDGSARLGPTAYALSPSTTANLDKYPWMEDLDVLQKTPGFWTYRTPWNWTNKDAKEWHHHFAFTGQTREGWDLTGFIPRTEERGMNDSWMVVEERKMGRPPKPVDFAVYHQDHIRGPAVGQSVRVARIAGSREE